MSDLEDDLLLAAGQAQGGRKRMRDDTDSDGDSDELEAAPSKRGRAGADAEDGSESESEEEDSEDEDLLPSDQEDLFEDKDDRRRVMAMTELEREWELTMRQERRDRERERKELIQSAQPPPPRELPAEESQKTEVRTSSRQKQAASKTSHKDSALQALKKMRKTKKAAMLDSDDELSDPEPEKDDDYRAKSDAPDASDADLDQEDALEDEADDESEGDVPRRAYSPDGGYQEEDREDEAGDDELRAMQVRRHKLEKWVGQPFFDRCLTGCLVRLANGERRDERTGELRPHYVLAEVTEVVQRDERQYKFGNNTTNRFLVVRIGDREKRTEMTMVSNSGFTHEELRDWHDRCVADHKSPICKADADRVKAALREADNYKYTHEDVKTILNAKRASGKLGKTHAIEKSRLIRLLKAAQQRSATDEDARIEATKIMEQLEKLKQQTEDYKEAAKRADYSKLNARNRGTNFHLLNASNRPTNEKVAEGNDPFMRRVTAPDIMWKTSSTDEGKPLESAEARAVAHLAKLSNNNKEEKIDSTVSPEEAARQLDLFLDLGLATKAASRGVGLSKLLLGARWGLTTDKLSSCQDVATKSTLTLTDYRRKAGY